MTGQVGRPGTGPASAARPEQRAGRLRRRPDPDGLSRLPAGVGQDRRKAPASRTCGETKLDPKPGLTVVEIMHAIHAGEITACTSWARTRRCRTRTSQHAREALAKLEHLVVQDLFLTETAFHADVILPASAWPEKDGTVTNTNRQVQMGRQALPLPGDARQDWWIIQEIAQPPRPRLELSSPARRLRRDGAGDALARQHHLGPAAARKLGHLSLSDAPDQPGHDIVFSATVSPPRPGAASWCRRRSAAGRAARRRLSDGADHRPPARALAHRRDDAARDGARHASSPRRSRACTPATSQRSASQPGEPMRVTTRRGAIELKARADPAVADRRGVHPVLLRRGGRPTS